MPRISIILPAFNAAHFLQEAVHSLLTQTFGDFELIAINDGSTDSTAQILDQLAAQDSRIQVIHQPNQRIVETLNRGCLLAQGEFLAIMHADDIALPTRLQKQLAFLDTHPDIQLCGTAIQTIRQSPDHSANQWLPGRTWTYPADPDFIPCFLLFWCCLAHPTAMMRATTFHRDGLRYDKTYNHAAEDYGLWAACAARYRISNIQEPLLQYREHPAQGSEVFKKEQRQEIRIIRRRLLERLGLSPTQTQMTLHQQLSESELEPNLTFVLAADAWLREILSANDRTRTLPAHPLAKVLGGRWAAVCLAAANLPGIWKQFWSSPLSTTVDLTLEKNRAIPPRP